MPKVKGPLLSATASGKLGRDIVYTSWKGQARVTGLRLIQKNKFWLSKKKYFSQTRDQQGVRGTFKKAIIEYEKLSAPEKQMWKNLAKNKKNTAVGLFIKYWIDNFYNGEQFKKYWLFSVGLGFNLFLFKEQFMESFLVNRMVQE